MILKLLHASHETHKKVLTSQQYENKKNYIMWLKEFY